MTRETYVVLKDFLVAMAANTRAQVRVWKEMISEDPEVMDVDVVGKGEMVASGLDETVAILDERFGRDG